MNKRIFLFSILCLAVLPIKAAVAEPDMNPGMWEITTQTEMPGMPGMIPPVTYTQCIKEDDPVPRSQEESKECRVMDIKEDGDAITWKIVCSGKNGEMEGTGKVIYKGNSMTGTMDMVIKGAAMRIKNTISGKRIGDCD
jgi:hypothetical protein